MNNFLKKIKLAEDFSLNLDVSKAEFISKISKLTKPESMFASLFGDKEKLFIGSIDSSNISIRPMRSSGTANYSFASQLNAIVFGNINRTMLEGTLQISKKYFVMMLAPALFYFSVAIPIFTIQIHSVTMSIAIIVQFLFMIGIFYFILRKAIKVSKNYFEKELFFITKHN